MFRRHKSLPENNQKSVYSTTSDSHQQGISSRSSNDARNLDEMNHGVSKEDQIHFRSSNSLVHLLHVPENYLLAITTKITFT